MNYQKLILVGNVTADAERRTSENSEVGYTTFGLAVGDARGRTIFFPVALFGQRGEAIGQYLTKGRQVLVEGRITLSESGRFNVVADNLELGVPAAKPAENAK